MMIDEDSLKSRVMVMVMVMVRITIRIANPNHDPAGCGQTTAVARPNRPAWLQPPE